MKRKDASAVQRAALDRIGREARMRSTGDRLPTSIRIQLGGGDEHDPDDEDWGTASDSDPELPGRVHDRNAEDWDKVDDDAPTMRGSGPRERKHERRHTRGR